MNGVASRFLDDHFQIVSTLSSVFLSSFLLFVILNNSSNEKFRRHGRFGDKEGGGGFRSYFGDGDAGDDHGGWAKFRKSFDGGHKSEVVVVIGRK